LLVISFNGTVAFGSPFGVMIIFGSPFSCAIALGWSNGAIAFG
jgi:hypothetical protein